MKGGVEEKNGAVSCVSPMSLNYSRGYFYHYCSSVHFWGGGPGNGKKRINRKNIGRFVLREPSKHATNHHEILCPSKASNAFLVYPDLWKPESLATARPKKAPDRSP